MTIDSRAAACGRRGGGSRALWSENDTDDMLWCTLWKDALVLWIAPCFESWSPRSALPSDPAPVAFCGKRQTSERKPINKAGKKHAKPVFFWEKLPKNENRTHTPPPPHAYDARHRAFKEEDPSTRASPALADRITFQMKPMAHV